MLELPGLRGPTEHVRPRQDGCRSSPRRIGGFSCGGFVSADDQLNVTGLFDAAVSAPQNPVSRKQRPTVTEKLVRMALEEVRAVRAILADDFGTADLPHEVRHKLYEFLE
jgi:hypothetical protein